jgi:hypothetical protein
VGLLRAVGADEQSTLVVQMADRALDDPAILAEPGAVLGLASGDRVGESAGAQQAPVLVVVVAAVGDHTVWAVARAARRALHLRNRVDERQQLRHVVAIGAGHRPRQKQSAGVGQDVVLGARSAAVDRARAEPGAPFFACT